MDDAERRAAKARLVEGMLQGQSWEDAVIASGLDLRRSAAYRLTQRVCVYGDQALEDHRHGHVSKMREPVRQWLEAYCRGAPGTPSRLVQAALRERFGFTISITHLNRVRASLGIGHRATGGGKRKDTPQTTAPSEDGWQEGAGGLLLLAGVEETALLPALEQVVQRAAPEDARLARARPATRRQLVLTLLFLGAVGLRRPWDLRGYTGVGLALLTGRHHAYGYRTVERFLAALAAAGGADLLTDALAAWTTALWRPDREPHAADVDAARPSFYIDGHRKAVYSAALLPRGLVARRGAVLGCRALALLHDRAGIRCW